MLFEKHDDSKAKESGVAVIEQIQEKTELKIHPGEQFLLISLAVLSVLMTINLLFAKGQPGVPVGASFADATPYAPDPVLSARIPPAGTGFEGGTPIVDTDLKSLNSALILQTRPFIPIDPDLQNPLYYPQGSPMEPAAKPAQPRDIPGELTNFLKKRFPDQPESIQRGLNYLGDPRLISIIPDEDLRASLLTTLGTPGEAVISTLLEDRDIREQIHSVDYGQPPFGDLTLAQVVENPNGRVDIIVNERYRYEPIQEKGPILIHEFLHVQDMDDSYLEEMINHLIQSIILIENRAVEPETGLTGTELVRRQNSLITWLINSCPPESTSIDIFSANGENVFPGSPITVDNFSQIFPTDRSTNGNSLLTELLDAIGDQSGTNPPDLAAFDEKTLYWLNDRLKQGTLFSDTDLLWVALGMRLGYR